MQLKFEQEYYRIKDAIKSNNKRGIKGAELQQLLKDIVDSNVSLEYSTKRPYSIGCVCMYLDVFYVCINDTSGLFNAPDWQELTYILSGVTGIISENNEYLLAENFSFIIQE